MLGLVEDRMEAFIREAHAGGIHLTQQGRSVRGIAEGSMTGNAARPARHHAPHISCCSSWEEQLL